MTPQEQKKMQKNAVSVLIGGATIVYGMAFFYANDFGRMLLAGSLVLTAAVLGIIFFGLKEV